ncbi:DNA packaging protein [Paenibacillus sp. HN-1]|uniref:phage terminase large subunit family protein n=1 Tax=Paenibacillus TaxID=44249 RepID=UPI001CA8D147|nr:MULTISPECIES: DNA packaging protein [Paenibacillus]MBY9081212.1 DNA packaging protein [Paenibacillus sp. CGMCC 1.18879]MBY9087249.1 DNA packaging protein [Paenibacillus sinensis]
MSTVSLDKLRKLKTDFTYYSPRLLKIRTKDGQMKPLELNTMQRKIDAAIEAQRAASKPVRLIILKYRQGGASTYTEGRIFHDTSMNKLTNSLIVAHEDDASTNLFNMSKLFYDELPDELKPMKKASNAKEVVFENPTMDPSEKKRNPGLRSRIKIASANNMGAGRSSTIHNLHASEVAFWRDAKTLMLGLMQAVPNTPNTMVILESTANGIGDYFYNEWQRAVKGESDFVPLFFAWFEEPGYEMDVPDGFQPTAAELKLMEQYPEITYRKLVWRRWSITNNCGGDEELFKQEYPSDDMEAFLVSGRPRFAVPVLRDYLVRCTPGIIGHLEDHGGRIQFIPDPNGFLEVWERPKKHLEYYIGGDVAKGLESGDYSAAPVFSNKYDLSALWHGHIDPDQYAEQLAMLGRWYNDALIAVEENNHGLTVLNKLKLNYENLYYRTDYDKLTDEEKKELGWWSSEQTKRLAVDTMARLLREKKLGIKSKLLISECLTYVRDAKGATNAQEGSHDDTVMASAIILHVMETHAVPVQDIAVPEKQHTEQDNYSVINGVRKHVSEIEDEANRPDREADDEASWFRRMGW